MISKKKRVGCYICLLKNVQVLIIHYRTNNLMAVVSGYFSYIIQ